MTIGFRLACSFVLYWPDQYKTDTRELVTTEVSQKENAEQEKTMEVRGIDPRTSHMLSERSTI